MSTQIRNLNRSVERRSIDIEDRLIRRSFWAAAKIETRIANDAAVAPSLWTGRRVDAELSRDNRNPIRGWRWT